MANKFKLSFGEALDLVWKEIMEESEENFTDEFRQKVKSTLLKIREVA